MSYENDQLNKYDIAEAERFLMGVVKKPDPEFELLALGLMTWQKAAKLLRKI